MGSHSTLHVSLNTCVVEKKRKTRGDGPNLVAASSSKPAPPKPKNNTARSAAKPIERSDEPARSTVIERLASFNESVAEPTGSQTTGGYGHKRDERLALVEDLKPGPYQHKDIPDDPNFDKFEPHSSIQLSCVLQFRAIACALISGAPPPDRGISHTTNLPTSCGGDTISPPPNSIPRYAYSQTSKGTRFQWMASGLL